MHVSSCVMHEKIDELHACIDRVLVELSPVKVYAQVGQVEEFNCACSSRLRFQIEFITYPEWRWLVVEEGVRTAHNSTLSQKFASYRLPSSQWKNRLTAQVPIFPKLQNVICRIVNEKSETVAEVYASIIQG